jgi:type II secretory pathway component PulJ
MLMKMKSTPMAGFSLVEMLVALVINVILIFALVTVFSSNIGHYNKVSGSDVLMQQLESALQLMTTDIRRAGYWSNASNDIGTGQNNNPFMASGTDISVNGANNCILFTYDHNGTGTLPSISGTSEDDRYGYRLNGQTLQTRPFGASFSCDAPASAWENVTNPAIVQISNLVFTLTTTTTPVGATSNRIILRSVDISITGQLATDSTVSKTLTQHVRIQNDKYVP